MPDEPLAAKSWLLNTDFVHSGPDLPLIGAAGGKIPFHDFFNLENPPDPTAGGGAVVSAELAAKLVGPAVPGHYAQATEAPRLPIPT